MTSTHTKYQLLLHPGDLFWTLQKPFEPQSSHYGIRYKAMIWQRPAVIRKSSDESIRSQLKDMGILPVEFSAYKENKDLIEL